MTTWSNPFSLAVGDSNGDGVLDLAVAREPTTVVSLLLGNGDGTLQPPLFFGAGRVPYQLAVGDFNADGRLDLAAAQGSSDTIAVLINNMP